MKAGQYIRMLAEFITGELGLPKFKQLIEERLFELRQNPEMTEEKRILSSIELYLHEAEEGLREEGEVYTLVQSNIDKIILKSMKSKPTFASPTPPNLPYRLSKIFDVDRENTPEPIVKDLSLV